MSKRELKPVEALEGAEFPASPEVAAVELPVLVPSEREGASLPLGLLAGVGLEVVAVVGRRRLSLDQLLRLRPGAVVELERVQGEPIDLVVEGRTVARAEVVVVDGKLGARLTELLED